MAAKKTPHTPSTDESSAAPAAPALPNVVEALASLDQLPPLLPPAAASVSPAVGVAPSGQPLDRLDPAHCFRR